MDFKPTKIKRDKEGHYIMVKGWIQQEQLTILNIKRDKERHYIMVKGWIQQEELTVLNIYAPKTGAPRFIKQVPRDLQRDLDSHTIIAGDVNTPLSILNITMRQKINDI